MHHVHTRTISSTVTTQDPVSSLSPAVLFPFFHPPPPTSSPPSSSSSSPAVSVQHVGSTTSTSKTEDSTCPCHSLDSLPSSAIGPSSFVTLPSANSHQPLVLPFPQPPPPPLVTAPSDSASDLAEATSQPSTRPIMVFSHGTTQVDTFVPSISRLQHTLYSWSQLSDYTPKHCWELPATSSSSSQSSEPEGPQAAHNMSISNTVGRICPEEDVDSCPGHPWVNFSYHMQVRQWEEAVEEGDIRATQPPAAASSQSSSHHSTSADGRGLSVQLASPSGELRRRRRRSRQSSDSHSPHPAGAADAGIDHPAHCDTSVGMSDSTYEYDATIDDQEPDETKLTD